jgi:hypothetical protein
MEFFPLFILTAVWFQAPAQQTVHFWQNLTLLQQQKIIQQFQAFCKCVNH